MCDKIQCMGILSISTNTTDGLVISWHNLSFNIPHTSISTKKKWQKNIFFAYKIVWDRKNVQKITIHPPLIRNYGVFSLVTHPFWHHCMADKVIYPKYSKQWPSLLGINGSWLQYNINSRFKSWFIPFTFKVSFVKIRSKLNSGLKSWLLNR